MSGTALHACLCYLSSKLLDLFRLAGLRKRTRHHDAGERMPNPPDNARSEGCDERCHNVG